MREASSNLLVMSAIAKPLARMLLRCGIGFSDFAAVLKSAFVDVASADYGLRGRSTNISRVAALTGLSRKEVTRIREGGAILTSSDSRPSGPLNAIVHFWRYDPDFCNEPGSPVRLRPSGERSFETLVKRYGGDVPVSALKKELLRGETVYEHDDGTLELRERFYLSETLEDSVVKDVAFSVSNLLSTVAHNIRNVEGASQDSGGSFATERYLERCAWTDRLPEDQTERFVQWITMSGRDFIEHADQWIGENEATHRTWGEESRPVVGVGVYVFRRD